MAAAMGLLRWPPEVFWSATPRELIAALGAHGEVGGVEPGGGRPDLARLKSLVDESPYRSRSIRSSFSRE